MIVASDFLKWLEVFDVQFGSDHGPIPLPVPLALGGTGADLTAVDNAVFSTTSGGVSQLSATLPAGLSATNINLSTPILGTPQSGNLANCTGYPGIILTPIAAATTPVTALLNTVYYVTDASTVTITLPATAAAGSIVGIIGKGAGGWILAPGAGQTIELIDASASTSVASTSQYDSIFIMCVVANTLWVSYIMNTSGFTYS